MILNVHLKLFLQNIDPISKKYTSDCELITLTFQNCPIRRGCACIMLSF